MNIESNKTVWHGQDTVATLLSSLVQFATLLSDGRNAQINSRDDYFFYRERDGALIVTTQLRLPTSQQPQFEREREREENSEYTCMSCFFYVLLFLLCKLSSWCYGRPQGLYCSCCCCGCLPIGGYRIVYADGACPYAHCFPLLRKHNSDDDAIRKQKFTGTRKCDSQASAKTNLNHVTKDPEGSTKGVSQGTTREQRALRLLMTMDIRDVTTTIIDNVATTAW